MAASQPVSVRVRKAVSPLLGLVAAMALVALASPAIAGAENVSSSNRGALDCNGDSPLQQAARPTMNCTDIRGFNTEWNANTWNGRFYDNGEYIGHDEPDTTFLSTPARVGRQHHMDDDGSGRTRSRPDRHVNPGHDVAHWFQLSPAPWFSMAMCDTNSYPTNEGCTPESDSNAPTCVGDADDELLPGWRLGVHGDAAVSAGLPAIRRRDRLRRHALVRGPDDRQPRVHGGIRRLQWELRGASQLRLHPA